MTKVKDLENKLEELCKQLKAFIDNGGATPEAVQKIQEQLHALDEQYQDGKVTEEDGSIAPGQGEFSELLNEAHEMVQDLLDGFPDDD